jgi:DNA-binding NtrC family response regulator
VERLVVLYTGTKITKEQVLDEIMLMTPDEENSDATNLHTAMRKFEKDFILQIYKQNSFNIDKTAKALGTHRTTIMRKIREYKSTLN